MSDAKKQKSPKFCSTLFMSVFLMTFSLQTKFHATASEIDSLEISLRDPFSPSQNGRKPQALVLHYTALGSEDSLKALYSGVSAHYLVHPNGHIDQLVDESQRAWHAGVGSWGGVDDINSTSIGIEIVHYGFENELTRDVAYDSDKLVQVPGSPLKWFPWEASQITAVKALCHKILNTWNKTPERPQIQPWNVIGHSDLAPDRKQDPGALFPWEAFAKEGIGLWYDLESPVSQAFTPPLEDIFPLLGEPGSVVSETNTFKQILWLQQHLNLFGYTACPINGVFDTETKKCVRAFHLHFRPDYIGHEVDNTTLAILARLCDQKFSIKHPQPSPFKK